MNAQTETTAIATYAIKDLNPALGLLAKVVEVRNTIPVLDNIKFTSDGYVVATDLDLQLAIKPQGLAAGEFTLSLKTLRKIISGADKKTDITLQHQPNGDNIGNVIVTSDGMESSVDSIAVSDFPIMAESERPAAFKLPAVELLRWLTSLEHSVSDEQTRYYLRGVFTCLYQGALTLVSTDGHRLTKIETNVNGKPLEALGDDRPGGIIPHKTIKVLMALIKGSESDVEMRMGETRVSFHGDNWRLDSKLVDGTFPDFTRVIPALGDNSLRLDAGKLGKAAKRFATVSDTKYPHVGITAHEDSDVVELETRNAGQSHKITVDLEFVEGEFDCAFNGKYISDLCAVAPDNTLEINAQNASNPARITFPAYPDTLHILMPVRK